MKIFVADIDQDIDDLIAIEYLKINNSLDGVVLDPIPKSSYGKERVQEVSDMGIKIYHEIPIGTEIVFNGGAFTKIASYLEDNKLTWMIANGGFVGSNIVEDPLYKFKDMMYCRTYNPNLDPIAAEKVFNSENVDNKVLISKNVCHDARNTIQYLWKYFHFIKKYKLKDSKRLHDLLMCVDGLNLINSRETLLNYEKLNPIHRGLKGIRTEWGSELGTKVLGSVSIK